jgi:molybdopterin-guanine dinucleotide biosynthesis protein A
VSGAPAGGAGEAPLAAWILAGGRSRRFGSDKAAFVVDGEPLLDRTARVCREAGLAVTVVARHERPGGLPTLVEPDGPRHPLHGVATALGAAAGRGHTRALLVPVDLPALSAGQLRALLAEAPPVYATAQRLLAVLPVSGMAPAAAHAAAGAPVRAFLAAVGARAVEVGPVPNLNEPPG